jgi:hypothetical protein
VDELHRGFLSCLVSEGAVDERVSDLLDEVGDRAEAGDDEWGVRRRDTDYEPDVDVELEAVLRGYS